MHGLLGARRDTPTTHTRTTISHVSKRGLSLKRTPFFMIHFLYGVHYKLFMLHHTGTWQIVYLHLQQALASHPCHNCSEAFISPRFESSVVLFASPVGSVTRVRRVDASSPSASDIARPTATISQQPPARGL